ncbi:MAG TPA: hypothetical protein VG433_05275, partial [Pirellulales bacterium]|nr:hypothetical protein [Pirellulales bacterium]
GEMKSTAGATFTAGSDGAILADGANTRDVYSIAAATDLVGITGIRLEALTDPKLPAQGPGRAPNGNFVLSELRATAAAKSDPAKTLPVALQNASADYSQPAWDVAGAIDGNPATGWAVDAQEGKSHSAVFEMRDEVNFPGGAVFTFSFDHQFADGLHQLGKFRLSVTTSPRPLSRQGLPAEVAAILGVGADQRTAEQRATLAHYFRSLDSRWSDLSQRVATSANLSRDKRLLGAQDLAWALINSPAFLFNR